MKTSYATEFNRKKVLITGRLGFIGSNLARSLIALGSQVTLIDSMLPEGGGNRFNISGIEDQLSVHIADLQDAEPLCSLIKGQDYLFNLAGQTSHLGSLNNSLADLEANAVNQLKILHLCQKENPAIKIVFSSTRQVYGRPRYIPVDEAHPLAPVDYNGVSKLAGEQYHSVFSQVYGLRSTCLRMTNVYGPRMRVKDARQSFIGWWFRNAVEGAVIPVFSDGKQIRDFNHVEDIVDALLLCAANPVADGETYNLGGDEPVALQDLARMMVNYSGYGSWQSVPFPPERKKIDIGDYHGDYRKIADHLGWRPRITLSEGIIETLNFYRLHQGEYW